MKLVVVLLFVACIATSGRADSDPVAINTEEKHSSFHFTQEMCPQSETFYRDVTKVGSKCIEMNLINRTSSDDFKGANLERVREIVREICQRKPIMRQCLQDASTQIEVCNNETFTTLYKIHRDSIETLLEFGCSDDGERISNLVHEIYDFEDKKEISDSFGHCFIKSYATSRIIEESEVDLSTKLYNLNKGMTILAECLYQLDVTTSFKDLLKLFFDEGINNMKCIHPQDGVLIPCVEIDAGLFSVTNVCDLKTHGTNLSLYDVLEEESGSSSMLHFEYPGSEVTEDGKIRELVESECGYFENFFYTNLVSEICLNVTQQKEFQLLNEVAKSGFEAACRENGTLLENIMIGVYRRKNSGHGNAVWDCVQVAKATRNELDVHTSYSKNMRFYHELETFKGCLVNKLDDDVTSVASATSLIEETMKAAKCVHPEDGITVLCETLHVKA